MNFSDLILHPVSEKSLARYLGRPTHALLLSGQSGVGLGTIAKSLARAVAGANVKIVAPMLHKAQKTVNINIDDIREVVELARGKRRRTFVVVVDEAEKLTDKAPEAFLKILEEPVENLLFILTTHDLTNLPQTIMSRTQHIEILPPPARDCAALFDTATRKITATARQQIQFLAGNLPAEMTRLLHDDKDFRTAAAAMETAKKFVQGSIRDRLIIVANTTNQRETAITLMRNVAKLLTMTFQKKAQNGKAFAMRTDLLSTAIDNLAGNGNVRAQLLNVAVNF